MATQFLATDLTTTFNDSSTDHIIVQAGVTRGSVSGGDAIVLGSSSARTLVIDGAVYADDDGVQLRAENLTPNGSTIRIGQTGIVQSLGGFFDAVALDLTDIVGVTVVNQGYLAGTEAIDGHEATGLVHITNAGVMEGDRDVMELGEGAVVLNSGLMTGIGDGVVGDSGTTIRNSGTIEAGNTAIRLTGDASVTNDGQVKGDIGLNVGGGTVEILNTGTISGSTNGLLVSTLVGTVLLRNEGTIATSSGSAAAIQGAGGEETILNSGEIAGDVNLSGGADTFDGRGGTVSGIVFGGTGDDTFIIDDAGIVLSETAGQGTDTVQSLVSYALEDNFEVLELLGAEDIDGVGTGLQNTVIGNAGDNELFGNGSRDTMDGGDGNDVVDGGRGDDSLTGGSGDDYLAGRHGVDLMYGGAGADFIFGGIGDDALYGEDGDDTLKGGKGSDTLDGGDGSDTFVFSRLSDAPNGAGDVIDNFVAADDVLDFTGVVQGAFDLSLLGAFTGTGPSIRTFENSYGDTVVRIDVDGDGSTDMRVDLIGVTGLTEANFLL